MDMLTLRVKDVHVEDMIFLEIFSGTGGLTAAVRRRGLKHSVGVDSSIRQGVFDRQLHWTSPQNMVRLYFGTW